jgi:hypothetical protein
MSVLPADDRVATVNVDRPDSTSSPLKDRLLGMIFVTLAGVAMAGWLYLIAKVLWACIGWLLFD